MSALSYLLSENLVNFPGSRLQIKQLIIIHWFQGQAFAAYINQIYPPYIRGPYHVQYRYYELMNNKILQVSSWGGYVFLINLIPMHVFALMLTGRFSHRIYVAYSTVSTVTVICILTSSVCSPNSVGRPLDYGEHSSLFHGLFWGDLRKYLGKFNLQWIIHCYILLPFLYVIVFSALGINLGGFWNCVRSKNLGISEALSLVLACLVRQIVGGPVKMNILKDLKILRGPGNSGGTLKPGWDKPWYWNDQEFNLAFALLTLWVSL